MKSRGFTLIELLVVVAIVSLLSMIVVASLDGARKKARDTQRRSDIHQLQTAFELYYGANGKYPANPVSTEVELMNTGTADITPYISSIPLDPKNTGTNGYRYHSSDSAQQSYTMLIHLESNNNAWCSVGTSPGYSGWNNSDGVHYPPC
jgi:type II secretion system protein G